MADSRPPWLLSMPDYRYRLVNVFAEQRLGGNALCVFEDARDLTGETMQALARQFNLSETTFLLPSAVATATVRIFSPIAEFPFAGHPTLGSAAVVRALGHAGEQLTLQMRAGVIPVSVEGDLFTLRAGPGTTRAVPIETARLAQLLGLDVSAIAGPPMLVSTGNEQLLVPLRSPRHVEQVRIDSGGVAGLANDEGLVKVFVWADAGEERIAARFFFGEPGTGLREDPGTGSACANLGAWLVAVGRAGPLRAIVHQGDHLHRACRIHLHVDAAGSVSVGGRVIEVGRGTVTL